MIKISTFLWCLIFLSSESNTGSSNWTMENFTRNIPRTIPITKLWTIRCDMWVCKSTGQSCKIVRDVFFSMTIRRLVHNHTSRKSRRVQNGMTLSWQCHDVINPLKISHWNTSTSDLTYKRWNIYSILQPCFSWSPYCSFKYPYASCTAKETASMDQIVNGLKDDDIWHEAMKTSWNLETLRREVMKIGSASCGRAEVSSQTVLKVRAYSDKSTKKIKMTGTNNSMK